MNYFSSDWHLGHNNVIKYSDRPFSSINEMDDRILSNLYSLNPHDSLFFLGDLAFNQFSLDKFFTLLPKLKINFHWILGNHDQYYKKYYHLCSSISTIKEIKILGVHTTLCHYPMISWNHSHYNAYQLFGHIHHNSSNPLLLHKISGKMLNVNIELNNYNLFSELDIHNYMLSQPNNSDYIKGNSHG